MKNTVEIHVVETISEQIARLQETIRVRAYEKYLMRNSETGRELDDWLAAEDQILTALETTVREEGNRIIADILLPEELEHLDIYVSENDIVISSSNCDLFTRIALTRAIQPQGVTAECDSGILRISAPISGGAVFRKSA